MAADDVELRLLRHFVALAAAGSFTLAAADLGISQPALSQSMQRLERGVGRRLVDRGAKGITLTPAGLSLLSDATSILVRVDGAVQRAARTGDPAASDIVVGFSTTASREVTSAVLSAAADLLITVRLRHLPWGDEPRHLHRGDVDVLIIAHTGTDDPDLLTVPLRSYHRVALLPCTHRLAGRDSITLAELDGEPIIDAGSDADYWLVRPRPGYPMPPVVGPAAQTAEEMLALVSAGHGMAITSASVAQSTSDPTVRFVPITDLHPVHLVMARLRHDKRRPVLRLFDAVQRRGPGNDLTR